MDAKLNRRQPFRAFRGFAALLIPFVLCNSWSPEQLIADTFTIVHESGETRTISGLLAGSGQGVHAIELSDGSLTLVPELAVKKRIAAAGPDPLKPFEMVDRLTEEFGVDNLRTIVREPYVVALVLAGPLPEQSESHVTAFLKNASQFLDRVDTVFSGFCHDLRIQLSPPRYPLVMLVFESDRDFDRYTREETGGRGLSSDRISGFYAPINNRLAIRIGECRSFQVPLHEAIHQQVYNRGLFQRLADIPVWFNEGIATGFENNGERINIGPNRINSTYARRLLQPQALSWHEIVTKDEAFRGDILAGEAYSHAWSIHWSLVTRHRAAYASYVRQLGQMEPLQQQSPEARRQQFEEAFHTTIDELEVDFPRMLKAGMKRQGIQLHSQPPPGYSLTTSDASEVQLTAIRRTSREGLIEVQGRIRNVSPFRDLAFYVTVQTDGGRYAEWFIPCVNRLQSAHLPKQFVIKELPGRTNTEGTAFWVEVASALPESEELAAWKRGEYPLPTGRSKP